jgi:hypothetical protein
MKKPNILTRLFSFLKGWYEVAFQKFENEGYAGVVLTNWIKEQLDKGTFDQVTQLTPTDKDDLLLVKAKQNLPALFAAYGKAHGLAVEGKSNIEILVVVGSYVNSLTSRRSFLVEISTDIIVFLADGQISWNEALIIGQKLFWQFFNKKRKLAVAA